MGKKSSRKKARRIAAEGRAKPGNEAGAAKKWRAKLAVASIKPLPDSRMPLWRSVLSRSDAADLIAYIKTLWSPYIRGNCQGAKHMNCMGGAG